MVVLDTQVVIDAINGRLRRDEERILDDFWAISAITLWELSCLSRENRIRIALDDPRLRLALDSSTIYPIDFAVARALQRLDFRSDPADEIIAATSLAHGIPLLTRDTRILASKVVPFALQP